MFVPKSHRFAQIRFQIHPGSQMRERKKCFSPQSFSCYTSTWYLLVSYSIGHLDIGLHYCTEGTVRALDDGGDAFSPVPVLGLIGIQ